MFFLQSLIYYFLKKHLPMAHEYKFLLELNQETLKKLILHVNNGDCDRDIEIAKWLLDQKPDMHIDDEIYNRIFRGAADDIKLTKKLMCNKPEYDYAKIPYLILDVTDSATRKRLDYVEFMIKNIFPNTILTIDERSLKICRENAFLAKHFSRT